MPATHSTIGRAPHLLEVEFLDARFVRRDGRTLWWHRLRNDSGVEGETYLDAHTILLDGLG